MVIQRYICTFLVFGLLCSTALTAQVLPSKPRLEAMIGKVGEDVVVDLVENWQGQLAVVGNSSKGLHGGDDLFFALLDDQLAPIQTVQYIGRNNDDGAFSIAQTLDGLYAIAGFSTMPSAKSNAQQRYFGGKDGWLLILDEDGITKREIILGGKEDDEFRAVFSLPNGDFIVLGNTGNKHAWLLRLSATGAKIWERKIQSQRLNTQALSGVLTQDERIYISGAATEGELRKLWLAAYDLNGEVILDKTFPAAEAIEGQQIVELDQGQLGLAGYVIDPQERENAVFCIVDRNGNQVNYQSIGGREDDRFFGIRPLMNKQVALIGRSKSFERGSRRDKIFVVLFDEKGKKIEERFYGSRTTDEGYDILQRRNGAIVIGGLSSQSILKSQQAWLALLKDAAKSSKTEASLNIQTGNIIYPHLQYLEPGERAIYPLQVHNNGQTDWCEAIVTFQANTANAPKLESIKLPILSAGTNNKIYLPLPIPENTPEGVFEYEAVINRGGDKISAPWKVVLRIGKTAEPRLELSISNPVLQAKRGVLQKIRINVKNTGLSPAHDVSIFSNGADKIRLPTPSNLGSIASGQTSYYDLPFEVFKGFLPDSAWLRIRVADGNLVHTDAIELKFPVTGDKVTMRSDSSSKADYITAVWISPNPDLFEHKQIVWSENEIIIQIKVVSSKGLDKQHFCLEINGQPCQQGAKMDEVSLKGSQYSRTYFQRVKLGEGVNTFKAIVQNEAGKQTTDSIKVVFAPRKPNLHLISIGVPSVDLKYTSKDARDFVKAIHGRGKPNQAFQAIFVDTLFTEAKTTKTEILKTLRRLQYRFADRQIASHDLIVVFISAHGLNSAQGEFRIAASDYDNPFMQETSLDFEKEIINYLNPIECRKLFFVDACHSGAGGNQGVSGTSLANLANNKKGLNLLLSCRSDEYSYEDDSWQNGAFTETLVEALESFSQKKSALDRNGDQQLDLKELYQKIQIQVPSLVQTKKPKTNTSQNPLLILNQLQEPFVLFQLSANN
jgi:Caspase domain